MKMIFVIGFLLSYSFINAQALQLETLVKKLNEIKTPEKFAQIEILPSPTDTIREMPPPKLSLLDFPPSQAIFCQIEDHIRRSSQVFFKFRLGSVETVDRLEGKYIPTIEWKHF